MLVQTARSGQEGVVELDRTWLQKKWTFVRFVLERLWFLPFEQSKAVRFQFNIARFGRNIAQNELIENANIVHLHWITFGFLSIDSLRQLAQTQKPMVWTLHDMWAFTGGCHYSNTCENYQAACGNCTTFLRNPAPNDLSHRVWEQKQKAFQNINLTIVACSDWLGQRAKKSSLLKNHRVVNIPNPIDEGVFRPIPKIEARKKLGLDPHKNYILFVAMLADAPRKGFAYLKAALQNGSFPNTELLVMGRADVESMQDLPLKVNALGQLSDIQKIVWAYSAASVFVIPSLEENLPNTIMEALACGTPSVGFEVGGIPEMIDHRKNGYVATYQSATDLGAGLAWVLNNENYEQLCHNARQKVLDNYTEEIVGQQYLELYKELV